MATPIRWEVRGTLFLESTSTESLAFSDTLTKVFFNTSGNWSISDTIIANNVILNNGTVSINNAGLLSIDTLEVRSGSGLLTTATPLYLGYAEIQNGATFTPTATKVFLRRPPGTWNSCYFRYYPSDSIYLEKIEAIHGSANIYLNHVTLGKIEALQGSASIYLNHVVTDSVFGPNTLSLDAVDSDINYFDAGYPDVELTRSHIAYPIIAGYLNVRLYDYSTVPHINSSGWAYVCLKDNCATDSVIAGGALEIGGQNNISIPLVRASTINMSCAGGPLELGEVHSQGDIQISIPVNMDELHMGYPAKMTLGHSGTTAIDHLVSMAPCDSTNRIESNTSFVARTLNIATGTVQNTHFRDVTNNTTGGLTISSGDLVRTSGFTSSTTVGAKYYWVGGTGNWTDMNHWSTTSGGTANAPCIPSSKDTVIIDDNSANTNFTIQLGTYIAEVAAFLDESTSIVPSMNSSWDGIFRVKHRLHNTNTSFYSGMYISLEGEYTDATIKSIPKLGRVVLGSTGQWSQIDTLKTNEFYFYMGSFDQNEHPLFVENRLANNRDEHGSYITGTVDWNLENTEAHVRQIAFENGGNYTTHVGKSVLYLDNWQYHQNNDSINFHRIMVEGSGGEFTFQKGIWHAQSLYNPNDLKLEWWNTRLNVDSLIMESPATISSNSNFAEEFRIGHFIPNSNCGSRIALNGSFEWAPTAGPQLISFANINDVYVTRDSIIAVSSTDLGNNTNVSFTPDFTRTLYWVNDGGSWNDSIHWSLTSGGLGGECLPTPIDSVVFDHNSFTTSHQVNINNTHAYAHDIIIDTAGWAAFSGNRSMYFYGSLIVLDSIYITPYNNDWIGETQNLDSLYILAGQLGDFSIKGENWRIPTDINVANTFRNYADSTYLDSGKTIWNNNNSIENHGKFYSQYDSIFTRHFRNYGNWFDTSSVIISQYDFNTTGTTFNQSTEIFTENIYLNGNDTLLNGHYEASRDLEISNTSHLVNDSLIGHRQYYIRDNYSDSNTYHYLHHNTYLNPQWGEYARFYMQTGDTVGNFRFEGINQAYYHHTSSGNIQNLHLLDNTLLYDSPQADSLYLYAGNTYEIEAGKTLLINDYLQAFGTFCDYIYIRSADQGSRAYIDSDFQIFTNFCEYRDIEYNGTATYYAGAQSTDQGNNHNILWDNIPGYIWGFPSDTLVFFCHDSTQYSEFILNTNSFQNAVSFLWDNGSDSTHRVITESGLYSVTALYETCSYTDSIHVNFVFKPELESPQQYVCANSSAMVYSPTPDGLNALWSNNATQDTAFYTIESDTAIFVSWYRGPNYLCSDTIFLNAVSIDSTLTQAYDPLCHNDVNGGLSITSVYGGHGPYSFQWPHDPTLTTTSDTNLAAGCYPYLITDTLGCMYEDSICLSNPAALYADFIVANPFCEGQNGSAQLLAFGGTPSYTFDIAGADTTSLPEGTYAFTVVDANGCEADTSFDILHTFDFYYSVQLDTATCGENNGAFIVTPYDFSAAYTYSWSNYPGYFNNGQIFMPPSNGYLYITDSIAGCIDTVYYEIPTAGISNATFLTDLDSGVSPLTIQTTNLNTDPNLTNYWIINGDTISNAIDTSFVFPGYGNYFITHCLYDPTWGCIFCFDKEIIVLPNPDISVPNFFTPNYDGANDFFELAIGQDIDELVIDIYNRWGNLMFHSNEVNFRWDATMPDGGKASDGVYLWTMTYREVNGQQYYTLTGTVTIMDSE